LFIRFTARFFRDDKDCITDFGKWFCRLNFIIGNYNRTAGDVVHDRSDRSSIEQLITLVQEENRKADRHSRRIMQGMMVSILEIIARNVENMEMTQAGSGDSKFAGMLLHIQFNLLDEDKIAPSYLCAKFHIAETYFSEYFKKNAGEKFQNFILLSRLRLAETRVLYTDSSFKEIAYDLGFTDSSHLNRMMKKFLSKRLSDIKRESVVERGEAA
jgi:AraC-like DNA-binding protein